MYIYLAQLTHENGSILQNRHFPLGIGLIGAYLQKSMNGKCYIELFKRPSMLNTALNKKMPEVMMFSIFLWNEQLTLSVAKRIKEISPETLIVLGGPNISIDYSTNVSFMKDNSCIDILVLTEGEFVSYLLVNDFYKNRDILSLKKKMYPSTLSIEKDKIFLGDLTPGKKNTPDWSCKKNKEVRPGANGAEISLDQIPSPYLLGLFDKFFQDYAIPLIETNRGCPFKCSFCQQGCIISGSIRFYDSHRIEKELEYISTKIQQTGVNIQELEVADSNFLMYRQDSNIVKYLRKIQNKYSYPIVIGSSTGKNKLDLILNNAFQLKTGSFLIRIAIQSLNDKTLNAIKRSNIKLHFYYDIRKNMAEKGIESNSDVMLGLPEETKASHFQGLFDLIDIGVDEFSNQQTIILKGTEMEHYHYRQQYGLSCKSRIIPNCLGTYHILGKNIYILESENIIIKTSTMSFNDYLECRKLHLTIMIFHNTRLLSHIYSFLNFRGIKCSVLIKELNHQLSKYLCGMFDEFVSATKEELIENITSIGIMSESEIQRITCNKIFKFLSIGLYKYADSLTNALKTSLGIFLGNSFFKESEELSEIFKLRIISPLDSYENIEYIFTSSHLVSLFGKKATLYLTKEQIKIIDMFESIYLTEDDKINNMAYHLRPSNMARKLKLIDSSNAHF